MAAWTVWHEAALRRRGKGALPTIDELLGVTPIVKRQSVAEARSVFQAMREQGSACT